MKIAFYTFGCKVNQYDSESMREQLETAGYEIVSPEETPDALIFNTCTVTAESDRKNRQILRRYRRKWPNAILVLTGCMVQAFEEASAKLSDADIVLSRNRLCDLPALLEQFLAEKKRLILHAPFPKNAPFSTPGITRFPGRTRAFMKVEDGCERYCSYCVIPRARGPVRSRQLEDIRKEAERLAACGFQEVVLVGINLSAYGQGVDHLDLCDAVEAVCAATCIKRVRLGSLEPDHINDGMLARLALQPKFCPQFHLSLQSGCDATLRRMNRHYDTAFYRDLAKRIRAQFPACSLTTDIMVGFPGETQAEFEESLAFVAEMQFAKAHVFSFSRRDGTMAYSMPNQISRAEKETRSRKMIEVAQQAADLFFSANIGTVQDVLFETYSGGFAEGYTKNYIRVRVPSDQPLCGQIRQVALTACLAEGEGCLGKLKE